jgi:hypothetical protein
MRFPVPFGYEADVLTASNKEVTRRYREVLHVEIPEFEAGGLPAVLTWQGNKARLDGHVDALSHGGGLFEVVTRSHWQNGGNAEVPVRADEIEAVVGSSATGGEPNAPSLRDVFLQPEIAKTGRQDDPYNHKGPPKPHTVLRSWDQERARETALSMAREFVVVGGLLHRRIPEPVLVATDKGVLVAPDTNEQPGRRVFRLDELDAAIDRSRALGLPGPAAPNFRLHRADLLVRDVEPAALFDAARSLLSAVRRKLPELPIPAMEAYCDLQEAYHPPRDYSKPATEVDPADLVRLGAELCEVAKPFMDGDLTVRECALAFERIAARSAPSAGPAAR